MKNIIKLAVLTIMVTFLTTTFLSAQEHNHNHKGDKNKESKMMMEMKKTDKNKDGIVYQCPMKCEAPKDAPGECSKCGMELEKISIKNMDMKKMQNEKMMEHKKNMKNHKEIMETKIKGMDNMKIQEKHKMKMKNLKTK